MIDLHGLMVNRHNGLLHRVCLLREDGEYLDGCGYPLDRTPETRELHGWGDMDGRARVYLNAGGIEVLIHEEATR